MRRWLCLVLAVAITLTGGSSPGRAQAQSRPVVVFIEDKALLTSPVTDAGPDSVTRLRQMFVDLGAEVRWQNLETDLPDDTGVVVLVRPLSELSAVQLGRLWIALHHGAHLLLAVDPAGLTVERGEGVVVPNPERSTSGLAKLLLAFYGIGLQDTLLTSPWFSTASLTSQFTTFVTTYPEDVVSHPVAEPLLVPDLPVEVWGARSLRVEPFGMRNYAVPLLYTREEYGEVNTKAIPSTRVTEPEALEINLDQDVQGHLLVGALGENSQTHSRVVVLGDSEMVQNDFGLAIDADGITPLYPGNWVLAQRIVAWLLNLPVNTWPSLSSHFTWIALDGQGSEWANVPDLITDDVQDALVDRYDIQTVRAFRDDSFMYLLVNLVEPPNPEVRLILGLENNYDAVTDVHLAITTEAVTLIAEDGSQRVVPDAQMAVGTALEVRLPLRVTGVGATISELCVADSRTPLTTEPLDCIDQPPAVVPVAATEAPLEILSPDGPRMIVRTLEPTVNVRLQPNTDSGVIELVPNGKEFAVLGRDEAGDWILVQNARYEGWIATVLGSVNTDVMSLPVVQP